MALARPLHAYVLGLGLIAVLAVGWAVASNDSWGNTLALGLLTLVAGSLHSRSRTSVNASLAGAVSVAAFIIVGPPGAVIAASFNFLIWRRGRPVMKRLYSGAQPVLDTFAAGWVYLAAGGRFGGESVTTRVVVAALLAYATLLTVNALLLSVVVKLDAGAHPFEVIRGMLAPTFLPMMGYGALGILLAVLWLGGLGPAASILMLLPLFVARWAFAQYEAEQDAHKAAIEALAKIVETKDLYTRGHSERVSHGVLKMGQVLDYATDRLQALGYAGLLHDVGKVGVPISVIRKSGALTDEEFAEIRRHPTRGVELVGDISFLGEAQRGILHHHERFDGSGYPSGLADQEIPEFARIIGVADAFDSMTTSRSYRAARSIDEAEAELRRCRGTHFDPRMVDAFLEGLQRFGWQPQVAEQFAGVPAADTMTIDHDDLPGIGSVPDSAAADPAMVAVAGGSDGGRPKQGSSA